MLRRRAKSRAGCAEERNGAAVHMIRIMNIQVLDMDPTTGIVQHRTVAARLKYGSTTWQKMDSWEDLLQASWEQILVAHEEGWFLWLGKSREEGCST